MHSGMSSKTDNFRNLRKKTALSFLVFFTFILSLNASTVTDTLSVATFGKIFVYRQTDKPENLVIMISGDAGWKYGVVSFAESFSRMNSMVIGVDILRYFSVLKHREVDCYDVAADFIQLAKELEKKFSFSDYKPPLIMGYSSGATLVYGILAQAPAGSLIGGISLGFCTDIDLPKMLCQTYGLTETTDASGKSYFLKPDEYLANPWIVLHGKLDRVCNYNEVEDFVGKTTDAELILLPEVGHGFSKWSDFMPQWKDAYRRLIQKYHQQAYIEN